MPGTGVDQRPGAVEDGPVDDVALPKAATVSLLI